MQANKVRKHQSVETTIAIAEITHKQIVGGKKKKMPTYKRNERFFFFKLLSMVVSKHL